MVKIGNRILSPTAINTYLTCPRKFYLRYIKRLRTRPSIYLIRGQIVHKTICQFHRNDPRIETGMPLGKIRYELLGIFKELWEKADYQLNSLGLCKEQIDFYHDDSELMLLNFSHWFYKNKMPTPDLCEARILSRNLSVMGIIDAVHKRGGKVVLVDYKTSKHARITNDMMRQAALYALLYEDRYKTVPDAVWIHFLKDPGDPQPIHMDDELLNYGKMLIQSVREKTVSQDRESYPCTCGGYCERDFIKG